MTSFLILTTGGTFDKEYRRGAGVRSLSLAVESAVIDTFGHVVVPRDWQVMPLLAKDSLDMTDADRRKILEACESAACPAIVITHGTDTMVETAAFIAKKNVPKTIVLTGAAQPARMKDSDADFNLGFAAAAALFKPPGVYVAMNGEAFAWNKCRKNPATGVFEAVGPTT
ncbi:MAG: asparaginase domain-containing protein, partial [Pseudolabrys sp.]